MVPIQRFRGLDLKSRNLLTSKSLFNLDHFNIIKRYQVFDNIPDPKSIFPIPFISDKSGIIQFKRASMFHKVKTTSKFSF